MSRRHVQSGTPWEDRVGYARAVRVGSHIHVSGTTATDEAGEIIEGGAYEQTRQAIRNIETALEDADAALEDVVRTPIFVTDIDQWEAIADAHADRFGDIRPATSMLEVSRLIDPDLLVEIEATAICADDT